MGIKLPSHLPWVMELLELEWPDIDEGEFEAASIGHRWIAALTDEAAADAHGGARIVAEANEGRSVEAFASYWCRGAVARIDRLTEVLGVTESAQYAMADHVTNSKSGVIWELEGLLDEIYRARYNATHLGSALSPQALRALPAVNWTRENVRTRLDMLAELLTDQAVRLRRGWLSGGSGMTRPRLATTWRPDTLTFHSSSYHQGASRIAHAADSMGLTGDRYAALRGRSSEQLRRWPPATWAAATFEETEAEFADLIRGCVAELQLTSDSLLASRTTMLEAEARNIELAYRAMAVIRQNAPRYSGNPAGSGAKAAVPPDGRSRISRLLNTQTGPHTWGWVSQDTLTGFQHSADDW